MRIAVNQKELAAAFGWVAGGLPRRPVVPVLNGVQLTVAGNQLTLAVFDYEQSRRAWTPDTWDETAEAGTILVDGPQLKKIVGSLPKSTKTRPVTVTLEAATENLTISVRNGATLTLPALPAEEYPALPAMPAQVGVVDGEQFARSVKRVAAAAGTDDTLPVLTTVQMTTGKGYLTLAATDRYRLAVDRMVWNQTDYDLPPTEVNVPAKVLTAFAKQASKFGPVVTVHLSEDLIGFRDDMRELTIRPNTGQYPRWSKMLRDTSPVNLTVDARVLATVVDNMPAEKNEAVRLVYADSVLTVIGMVDGKIAGSQIVPAVVTGAEQFEMGFIPYYLRSLLDGIDGKAVIGLAGAEASMNEYGREINTGRISGKPEDLFKRPKPATVNPVEADTFTGLVMPIRLETQSAFTKAA